MKVASLIIGILVILVMFLSLIPFLGSLNWINVSFAFLGLILGIAGILTSKKEQSKGAGITGIVLCSIAILVGIFRLVIGGGVI